MRLRSAETFRELSCKYLDVNKLVIASLYVTVVVILLGLPMEKTISKTCFKDHASILQLK